MRSPRRGITVAAGAVALLGTLGSGPTTAHAAAGDPAPTSIYAPSALVLTVSYPGSETVRRAVMLRCTPLGGDHPAAAESCAALAVANGDFAALPATTEPCTREYRPVTVTAQGVWRGTVTSYRKAFANPCLMLRGSGPLFAF
jgi:hypothetical protein